MPGHKAEVIFQFPTQEDFTRFKKRFIVKNNYKMDQLIPIAVKHQVNTRKLIHPKKALCAILESDYGQKEENLFVKYQEHSLDAQRFATLDEAIDAISPNYRVFNPNIDSELAMIHPCMKAILKTGFHDIAAVEKYYHQKTTLNSDIRAVITELPQTIITKLEVQETVVPFVLSIIEIFPNIKMTAISMEIFSQIGATEIVADGSGDVLILSAKPASLEAASLSILNMLLRKNIDACPNFSPKEIRCLPTTSGYYPAFEENFGTLLFHGKKSFAKDLQTTQWNDMLPSPVWLDDPVYQSDKTHVVKLQDIPTLKEEIFKNRSFD